MGIWEIVGGALLIVISLLIVLFVSLQSDKSDGLSGAIAGGSDNAFGGRGNSNDEKLAKITKVLVIFFFILTLVVNIFVLVNNR
ncbi:MAG: preprotein translocase subunit SecG [Oscillospiraceae bacterium]|nr:preprotein translocase subunit SecG [Oscillospiraceae bacterium]